MEDRALHKHILQRRQSLLTERGYHEADWRELSDFVLGSRGRFLGEEGQKPDRSRNDRLYNETAKQAAGTLASGMMAGITSPARPWFKLGTPDPDLMEHGPVKEWLDEVQRILLMIFARSNFYNSVHAMYLELGTFGVAPMAIFENYQNVIRCEPYTIGSYSLGMDGERNVDTLYRDYMMTVGGMVQRFGAKNCSNAVQRLYDRGAVDTRVKVFHAMEPNKGRQFDSPLATEMAMRSVYYEEQCDGDAPLLVSGFQQQPFMAPRWSAVAEDTYSCDYPGINSLGTNKSLQIEELDKAIATEKMHNPPLVGDSSLESTGINHIAGHVTYVPGMMNASKPGLASIYDTNPRIAELSQSIKDKEDRIQRFFFADLFLMVTELDRAQITATEIAERKEEKMLMLGPVLERLNYELLDPTIDRVFSIAQKAGILPPPPEELREMDLRVEYISVLAQAQKAVSTASIEATTNFAMNLSQVWPEARHKVDAMQAIDDYAKAKGAPVRVIRSDDDAQAAVDAEQQQMAQQAQMEQAMAMADSAKTMSETDTSNEDSALGMIAGAMQ